MKKYFLNSISVLQRDYKMDKKISWSTYIMFSVIGKAKSQLLYDNNVSLSHNTLHHVIACTRKSCRHILAVESVAPWVEKNERKMESRHCEYYSLHSLLERAGLTSETYVHLPLQNVRSSCCQIQTEKSHLFSNGCYSSQGGLFYTWPLLSF